MNIISKFPEEDKRGPEYYIPLIIMAVLFLIGFAFLGYFTLNLVDMALEEETIGEPLVIIEPIEEPQEETIEEITQEVIEETIYVHMTDDDIIAAVVMAEAGNQEMIGKVAVAVTVLNRCDYWDASVESIVSAPNQYSYPYTGVVTEECYDAVRIARQNRDLFPKGMMWFLPSGFPSYGHPYLQIEDHYFSYMTDEEMEDL